MSVSPPSMTGCYLGDEFDCLGELYDARSWKRASAAGFFARDRGIDFVDVQVTTRYARFVSIEEQWQEQGRDRWASDWIDERALKWSDGAWRDEAGHEVEVPEPPEEMPEGWQPDEDMWSWEFCEPTAPGAVKVYVCEERDRATC